MNQYIPTIGLEIHMELKTKTKMFCGCLNNPEEKIPNVNVCPICLAHPGILPLANKKAIRQVLKLGYALNGKITQLSKFDRKNYFYPDLPKGYQISQFDFPFVSNTFLEIPLSIKEDIPELKKIRIRSIHLEEDAGKLSHSKDKKFSFVNFNRAGVPLAELVTEPDIENGYQARMFAEELRRILRYLDISNGDMEKGEMRCEVNISIAKKEDSKLGDKVEIKNLNSFKAVEKSIDFEIKRQKEILEKGEKVVQETRGWDEKKEITFHQRLKEQAHDYRYFPEPDLPALKIDEIFDLKEIKEELKELPAEKRIRFINNFGLKFKDVFLLCDDLETANYFENIVLELNKIEKLEKKESEKRLRLAFNYFISDLKGILSKEKKEIKELKFNPDNFANLINLAYKRKISSAAVKIVLSEMFLTGNTPEKIIEEKNLIQVSGEGELKEFIKKAISESPQAVEDYKKGKENALQFLVGKSMALSKGRANPEVLREEIKKLLSENVE